MKALFQGGLLMAFGAAGVLCVFAGADVKVVAILGMGFYACLAPMVD